jgi:hypothetical protein
MAQGELTKGATAAEVAARLWPPPDPVNFCRREAIGRISAFDRKLKVAVDLRSRIDPIIFEDISRLWIHPTRTELRLVLLLSELRAALGFLQDATDLLSSARTENSLRFYDERLLEREEKKRAERD